MGSIYRRLGSALHGTLDVVAVVFIVVEVALRNLRGKPT